MSNEAQETTVNYATVQDIIDSGRQLSADEITIAEKKIAEASAMIRIKAAAQGKDFDAIIAQNHDYAVVANSVVVSCVIRYLNDNKNEPALSQFSQAAGGYSISGTYAAAGARVTIWDSEWKALKLKGQRYGTMEMFKYDCSN